MSACPNGTVNRFKLDLPWIGRAWTSGHPAFEVALRSISKNVSHAFRARNSALEIHGEQVSSVGLSRRSVDDFLGRGPVVRTSGFNTCNGYGNTGPATRDERGGTVPLASRIGRNEDVKTRHCRVQNDIVA